MQQPFSFYNACKKSIESTNDEPYLAAGEDRDLFFFCKTGKFD
jgi:hypothetical protein